MTHVMMFSGGVGSWYAARRLKNTFGIIPTLLFADTLIEDEDLYRFLREAADDIGGELLTVSDGRTPWEIYRHKRHIGNTRIANCSHMLKQDPSRRWVKEHCDPADTTIYLGIDWSEDHRLPAARRGWEPYSVVAPLCDPPYITKEQMLEELSATGIAVPRLYGMGFKHNNCGGFCVKAGHSQFALLLEVLPERYAEHEREEESLRQHLGKDVAILRDRRGGVTRPLTLREFRERGQQPETEDWGGCGCFVDGDL